ncbi:MAG: zinc ABC transporter substrate-binding protein [Pseudomonadota bacterium]
MLARSALLWVVLFFTGLTSAQPNAIADIAPVHSLVAQVMQGIGKPALILPQGGSPHHHALRPSQARKIARAEIAFIVGGGLTPWLDTALPKLAPDAVVVTLIDSAETVVIPLSSRTEIHQSADGDRATLLVRRQQPVDVHAWLDPSNARAWVRAIANALSGYDPVNADRYRDNAELAIENLKTIEQEISERLVPVRGRPYFVLHDAYRYFGARFDFRAIGAIADSHAARPGPARLSRLEEQMRTVGASCLFVEPGAPSAVATRLAEQYDLKIAVNDLVGAGIAPGPDLYAAMMHRIAETLVDCML